MLTSKLEFPRPPELQAREPPESRGLARDEVRLLVTAGEGHAHARFRDLPSFLSPGDLLVVNESATLPASLPAESARGRFLLNVSTDYGRGLYLVEPRKADGTPGPLPLEPGETIDAGAIAGRFVASYPGLPRLWFVQTNGQLESEMAARGRPIRYGYVDREYPLDAYQTIFGRVPGSAEMPSAARPFTARVLAELRRRGVRRAGLLLHTGVSSLELETEEVENQPMYPEPFRVPAATAEAVERTRWTGHRVIAVGTTVVRALESAWNGERVVPASGFTRRYVHPGNPVHSVDGLLTGFHDSRTTHLALLYALARPQLIRDAYAEAVDRGYLWHEFGDTHLILPEGAPTAEPGRRSVAS